MLSDKFMFFLENSRAASQLKRLGTIDVQDDSLPVIIKPCPPPRSRPYCSLEVDHHDAFSRMHTLTQCTKTQAGIEAVETEMATKRWRTLSSRLRGGMAALVFVVEGQGGGRGEGNRGNEAAGEEVEAAGEMEPAGLMVIFP